EAKGTQWKSVTADTARIDAEAILEAVVADLGEESVVAAINRQGLKGAAYCYLIGPLVDEAKSRRVERNAAAEKSDSTRSLFTITGRHPPPSATGTRSHGPRSPTLFPVTAPKPAGPSTRPGRRRRGRRACRESAGGGGRGLG